MKLSRRDEVVANRLRAGHSNVTHSYLFDDQIPNLPPICELCNNANLTIEHILLKCTALNNTRRRCMSAVRNIVSPKLIDVLDGRREITETMKFLKIIKLYDNI